MQNADIVDRPGANHMSDETIDRRTADLDALMSEIEGVFAVAKERTAEVRRAPATAADLEKPGIRSSPRSSATWRSWSTISSS